MAGERELAGRGGRAPRGVERGGGGSRARRRVVPGQAAVPSRGGRVALLVVVLNALEAVERVRETRVLPPRVRGGRGGWRTGERATKAARAVPGGRLVWVDAEHSQVLAGGREGRGERAHRRTRRRPRPAPSSQRAPPPRPPALALSLSLSPTALALCFRCDSLAALLARLCPAVAAQRQPAPLRHRRPARCQLALRLTSLAQSCLS